jgi:hypothetical protein
MASRSFRLLLLLGALAVVAGDEQTAVPAETCTLEQDEVCYPKCLPSCTAERDLCVEGAPECTETARASLQQQDRQCIYNCMISCFKTNNVEPKCRQPEPEPAKEQSEEEAKKAAEKAERKRKKKEEKERKKREKMELATNCGSCYGAEDHSPNGNGCCNTCDEVRRAYEVMHAPESPDPRKTNISVCMCALL